MNSNHKLHSNDSLSLLIKQKNIKNWEALTNHVKGLPYGRNENRKDFTLVWTEQRGTCSSKHAFLKHIANLNNLPNIRLILGMYKMNSINTPKIGDVLSNHNLDYIPEAHCYLKIDDKRFDYTSSASSFERLKNDVLLEKKIEPQQVAEFKVDYHKGYLKDWIKTNDIPFSFEDIWTIRELCIANLSG
jgi:hypothetical protein